MKFTELREGIEKRSALALPSHDVLLVVDPGITVGWAVFMNEELTHHGQLRVVSTSPTLSQLRAPLEKLLFDFEPDFVVAEEYRIYAHKTAQHANSTVPTLKQVTILEQLCDEQHIPFMLQSASRGKAFVTNAKLKEWGWYQKGNPHACDAIRHGAHYLLFGRPKTKRVGKA